MAKLLTADQINAQAEQLEKDHADDVWRSAAAGHLRAAGNFIRLAEQQEQSEAAPDERAKSTE